MAHLELEQVTKIFPGGTIAVDRLSLEVRGQELLALVGASGCGKTTTLRLIAGLETCTSGSIRINGQSVEARPPHERDVALVFQHPALYPHWNVRRNLEASLALRGQSGGGGNRQTAERVAEVAQLLELEGLLTRMPGELSGGQRQRVALGRALVRRPRILLLDEPLSALEPASRETLRRTLKRLHAAWQITTIHVTHDQQEAMALGDRVAVLHHGRLEQLDTPDNVYRRPANRVVASLMGSPPMNLLEGKINLAAQPVFCGKDWVLTVDSRAIERVQPYVSSWLTLGFRAEHACLRPMDAAPGVNSALTGRVGFIESLGSSKWVWVSPLDTADARAASDATEQGDALDTRCAIARGSVVVQTAGRPDVQPGQLVEVTIDWQQAHWFAADGRRLCDETDRG